MPTDPSDTNTAIAACHENADVLVTTARQLVTDERTARIACGLSVIALEEIGKAVILSMCAVGAQYEREPPLSIRAAVDDHVRKLFWAIWGPSWNHETITGEQIDENRGLAERLHLFRLRSLYVDFDGTALTAPTDSVWSGEARDLLRFAEARLALAKATGAALDRPDPITQARTRRFFELTDDPESRQFVFSSKSMEKLKALGSTPKWVDWLFATLDKAETEAKLALEKELRRRPDHPEQATPKWRATIRVHSTSHSIRQRVLNDATAGLEGIRFRGVSGKPGQILVDVDAKSSFDMQSAIFNLLHLSRRIVMALNVGTLGYFWFHEPLDADPLQSGKYYEKFVDLVTEKEVKACRTPPLRWELGPRRALERVDFYRWSLCCSHLLALRGDHVSICERYLDGMAMVAKSDAHMAFELQAVAVFYLALKEAVELYRASTDVESVEGTLRCISAELLGREEDDDYIGRLCAVGESVNSGSPAPYAMNMNDVGVMKALCDTFLLRTFLRLGPPSPSRK